MQKPAKFKDLGSLILLTLCICLFQQRLVLAHIHPSNESINQSDIELSETDYFITTWQTTEGGEAITIPTAGSGYNYSVDWGDGQVDHGVTGNVSHSYDTAGIHTVRISGDFTHIFFNNSGDKDQLLTIEQWGTIAWTSMSRSFFGCTNMQLNATDAPDLSSVTSLEHMFSFTPSFNGSLNHWDVSNVTDMNNMFYGANAFNQPLDNWDVSKVTKMNGMFGNAHAFNQNISGWDVSRVTKMDFMFSGASSFNQPLNSWDVSKVTNMEDMFRDARSFNQPLNGWNVSSVSVTRHMFNGAHRFNQDLDDWNVSNVWNMQSMFYRAYDFNGDVTSWEISGVTNMWSMFEFASSFNQDLSGWKINDACLINNMFQYARSFNQNLGAWSTNATQRSRMLNEAGMDCGNYTATLIGWERNSTANNVVLDANMLEYGTNADAAVNELVNNRGWTINAHGSAGGICLLFEIEEIADVTIKENLNYTVIPNLTGGTPIGAVTYTLGGTDADDFTIDAATGGVSMVARDFENPVDDHSDNVYELTITATDSDGNSDTEDWTVTVEDVEESGFFITTWQTTEAEETITIPTTGSGYNYTVNWGDGTESTGLTGNATHSYDTAGTYTVMISGDFPRIFFNNPGNWEGADFHKIRTIEQWGTNPWTSMAHAFSGCRQLIVNATDIPDLSNLTSMREMFDHCYAMNAQMSDWDVSNVTNMLGLFREAHTFNQDISNWDVSNVTDMSFMFHHARSFQQDISKWDVSSVQNMSFMFSGASSFNQPLNSWDVSKVTNMEDMFRDARSFNQPLNGWNVSSVSVTRHMFNGAHRFNQDLDDWNVSNVWNMQGMFYQADDFNGDISGWDVSSVQNMSFMFSGASSFNQPLNSWDVSKVTNMEDMFRDARSFNQPLNGWNVSSVSVTKDMFNGAHRFNQDLDDWNVSNVWNMQGMFYRAYDFNGDISGWDVSSVQNMSFMFSGASSFNQPLNSWDVSKVTNMEDMFRDARSFNQPLNGWNVSSVSVTRHMFNGAHRFNQDLDDWNVSNVWNMQSMFYRAYDFNGDVTSWEISGVTNMWSMFEFASSFNQDLSGWKINDACLINNMFQYARSFNQNLGAWSTNATQRSRMLNEAGMDCGNYTATLIGWERNSTANNVVLDANMLEYGTNADAAVNELVNNRGWTINAHGSAGGICLLFEIEEIADVTIKENLNYTVIPNLTGGTPIGAVTYTLGGTDADDFTIDAATGGVSMVARDFENPVDDHSDNVYELTITATDSDGNSDTEDWTVTVEDVEESGFFITTWQTTEAEETITIPTTGSGYNYTVNWGDGTESTGLTGNATHSYDTAGTYTVMISGDFPRIFFNNPGNWEGADFHKIRTIEQWGTNPWTSMAHAFSGCRQLIVNATDIPDLSNLTSMREMFDHCYAMNAQMSDWDVSNVTNMLGLFREAHTFNQDISNWDVSNVTDMSFMFHHARSFQQDISKWDVSSVTTMYHMLARTTFDGDISEWDVSRVNNMQSMFRFSSFNGDISDWDVSNVRYMHSMFRNAAFNKDISDWDVGQVEDMSFMFHNSPFNGNITKWDVSNVDDMRSMFDNAWAFDQNLWHWNLNDAVVMTNMFDNSAMSCENYSATLNGWANNTSVSGIHLGAYGLEYGSNVEAAVSELTANRGWIITPNISSDRECLLPCPADSELLNVLDVVDLTCTNPSVVLEATTTVQYVSFQWVFEGNIVSDSDTVLAAAPGRYYAIATQMSTGCTTVDSVEVIDATMAPDLVVPNDSALTCKEPIVLLTASSATVGASISWEFEGNVIADPAISAENMGIYVAIASVGDCQTKKSVNISDNRALPELSTFINGEPGNIGILGCSTPSVTLSATTATPGADISWSVLGTTLTLPVSVIPNINAESAFFATVINRQTGCQNIDTVMVIEDTTVPSCAIDVPATYLTTGSVVSISTPFFDRYDYSWGIETPTSGWGITSGSNTDVIQLLVGDFNSSISLFVDIADTLNLCTNSCEVELIAVAAPARGKASNSVAATDESELSRTLDIYPNPATKSTITIDYVSPIAEQTTINVTNITGSLIRTLMEGQTKADHKYQFTFNQGGGLASGTYRLEIVTPSKTINRLVIIR